MPLTDRIATAHPAIVTAIFVIVFVAGAIPDAFVTFASPAWNVWYAISTGALTLPLIAWHYSLYRSATRRSETFVGHGGRRAFLFVVTVIGLAGFLVITGLLGAMGRVVSSNRGIETARLLLMPFGVLSYFASVWAASNALMRFEERASSVAWHKTVGTFLLEFYLPIGIWFLHGRIKNLIQSGGAPSAA